MTCVRAFRTAFAMSVLALLAAAPAAAQIPAPVTASAIAGMPAIVLDAPEMEPATERLDELAALFDEGALHDEQKRPRPLTRWTHPVEVTLRGDAAPRWLATVEAIAADLSAATGLRITVHAQPFWAGDIDIVVTNIRSYWPPLVTLASGRRDEPFTCIALPSAPDGAMRGSRIHVNAAVVGPDTAEACLAEELFQSMGLFGEVNGRSDTLLSDDVGFRRIGPVDRLLLSVLYDPSLAPNMETGEARATARRLLAERLSRN